MESADSVQSLWFIFFQAIFIENYIWAKFLGMCTCFGCSDTLEKANLLGICTVAVMVISNTLNWCSQKYLISLGALHWTGIEGAEKIDLSYMEFIVTLSITCGVVHIIEIIIESFSTRLSNSIGIYLRLLAVNCAVLAAGLTSIQRGFSFTENLAYQLGSGIGWWLASILLASLRKRTFMRKLPEHAKGSPILFIIMGMMSMSFAGIGGLDIYPS